MTTKRKPFAYVNKYTGKMVYLNQQPDAATDTEVYFPLWLHPEPFRENKNSSTESFRENTDSTTSDNHIADAGKMTGWIKCSDRMPDEGSTILAYQGDGIMFCYEFEDGYFYPDEFPNVPRAGAEITHWMPLPEAPIG